MQLLILYTNMTLGVTASRRKVTPLALNLIDTTVVTRGRSANGLETRGVAIRGANLDQRVPGRGANLDQRAPGRGGALTRSG